MISLMVLMGEEPLIDLFSRNMQALGGDCPEAGGQSLCVRDGQCDGRSKHGDTTAELRVQVRVREKAQALHSAEHWPECPQDLLQDAKSPTHGLRLAPITKCRSCDCTCFVHEHVTRRRCTVQIDFKRESWAGQGPRPLDLSVRG